MASKQVERASLCPECNSANIIYSSDAGEQVCTNCGLVLREHRIYRGPEWRAFTPEENAERSRVGSPVTILQPDKGLPTIIKDINRDAYGRKLSRETRLKMLTLRRLQSQYRTPHERNLAHALSELDRISDTLHIPENVKKEAAEIYRRALEKDLIRGRKIDAIAAACAYAACRRLSTPRSLGEIAAVSRVSMKYLTRSYRLLLQELPLRMPIPDPKVFVTKIASKLSISEKHQRQALSLIREMEKKRYLTGKDPVGLAAAALYLASTLAGDAITQKEISDASGVCELTVRNRYRGLMKILKLPEKPSA